MGATIGGVQTSAEGIVTHARALSLTYHIRPPLSVDPLAAFVSLQVQHCTAQQ